MLSLVSPSTIKPPAIGLLQGVSQLTLAVNIPVPMVFEVKASVIHPLVFNWVASITTP